ncbi:hypothetical protein QUB47_35445 [Microcoleus sp. AT9_B5]
MSQGFKIKSVDAKKRSGTAKNPQAVVEIGVIQRPFSQALWRTQRPQSRANARNINSPTS